VDLAAVAMLAFTILTFVQALQGRPWLG